MVKILVSACLLGVPCRYDGAGKAEPHIEKLKQRGHTLIPVCPEVLGGLAHPGVHRRSGCRTAGWSPGRGRT